MLLRAWLPAKRKPWPGRRRGKEQGVIEICLVDRSEVGMGPSHPPQAWRPEQTAQFHCIVLTQSTSTFNLQSSPGLCFEAAWGIMNTQDVCQRMSNAEKAGFAVGYHFGFLLNLPSNTQKLSVKRLYVHICLHSCAYMCTRMYIYIRVTDFF